MAPKIPISTDQGPSPGGLGLESGREVAQAGLQELRTGEGIARQFAQLGATVTQNLATLKARQIESDTQREQFTALEQLAQGEAELRTELLQNQEIPPSQKGAVYRERLPILVEELTRDMKFERSQLAARRSALAMGREGFLSLERQGFALSQQESRRALGRAQDDVVRAASSGDPEALVQAQGRFALAAESAGDFLPEGEITDAIESARRVGASAFVEGQIRQDPSAALALLSDSERLEADPLLSALGPEDRARLEEVAKRERLERQAQTISDLEIAVSRGEAGEAEIQRFFAADLISGATRTRLVKEADRVRREAQAVLEEDRAVAESLAGLRLLDPRNRDQRKAVDRFYRERVLPQLVEHPAAAATATADFSARVGMVPEVVQGNVRGALRAGDVESVVMASDTLDKLASLNPALLQDFSDEDIALGEHVSRLVRSGVHPNRAVEQAREAAQQAKAERDERKRRYDEKDLITSNPSDIEDRADTRLFGSPDLPDAIYGEYEQLVRDSFLRTGDEDVAREAAWRSLRRVWGETTVNGGREWMKYPPELYYGIGRDPAWIREQLLDDLGPNLDPELDVDRLRIVPDVLTAREAAFGQPSYSVLLQNPDTGEFEPMLDRDGEVIASWQPDFEASEAARREAIERAEEIENFRAARALRLRSGPGPNDALPMLQGAF